MFRSRWIVSLPEVVCRPGSISFSFNSNLFSAKEIDMICKTYNPKAMVMTAVSTALPATAPAQLCLFLLLRDGVDGSELLDRG